MNNEELRVMVVVFNLAAPKVLYLPGFAQRNPKNKYRNSSLFIFNS